jgi:Rrf2 family protein
MLYSVGCEYALRALSSLASKAQVGSPLLLRDILEGVDAPPHFVAKLFQALVKANILASTKGRGGGFALRRSADEIRIRDVVEAIDGPWRLDRCILGLDTCEDAQPCPQHDQWKPVRQQIEALMDRTTIRDLSIAMAHKMSRCQVGRKSKMAATATAAARV